MEYKSYIRLDTKHIRILKFDMYLPCMMFQKSDVLSLRVLYFEHFMSKNAPKNNGNIGFLAFW